MAVLSVFRLDECRSCPVVRGFDLSGTQSRTNGVGVMCTFLVPKANCCAMIMQLNMMRSVATRVFITYSRPTSPCTLMTRTVSPRNRRRPTVGHRRHTCGNRGVMMAPLVVVSAPAGAHAHPSAPRPLRRGPLRFGSVHRCLSV